MRAIAIFAVISLGATLFAGCAAIPATQPTLAMPVSLPDLSFTANGSVETFTREQIDLTGGENWKEHARRINRYESISLTASIINETGSFTSPSPVKLYFYISDQDNLTPGTVGKAILLMEANIPGGTRAMLYDSGSVPLSPEAGQLVHDGKFYLYITGNPKTIILQMSQVQMNMKVRMSLL